MPQDADKTGREILPIPDQPYRSPVPFDARDASAPQQPIAARAKRSECRDRADRRYGLRHPSAFGSCVDMATTDRLAQGCATRARNNF
jgi:hypothetical protein